MLADSTPEIRPMARPSTRKGNVTRKLVAPTYFMISISRRRAKTLRRMVLPTVMMLTTISTSTKMRPIRVTPCWISTKMLPISTGAVTLTTPGIFSIWLLIRLSWLRSPTVTR